MMYFPAVYVCLSGASTHIHRWLVFTPCRRYPSEHIVWAFFCQFRCFSWLQTDNFFFCRHSQIMRQHAVFHAYFFAWTSNLYENNHWTRKYLWIYRNHLEFGNKCQIFGRLILVTMTLYLIWINKKKITDLFYRARISIDYLNYVEIWIHACLHIELSLIVEEMLKFI